MKIFRTNRIIFEWIGIFESNDFKVKLVRSTCMVAPMLLLFPSIAYSVANISNVSKATSAFYITCVLTLSYLKYLMYLYHKSLIRSIVTDLQLLIKCCMEHQNLYRTAHRQSETLSGYFVILYFIALSLSMLAPVLVVIFHYLNGSYSSDVWRLPTSLLMPFDVESTPGYQISYLVCILAAYSIGAISTIEAFTYSVSLFIRAAFKDLCIHLQQLDSQLIAQREGKLDEKKYSIHSVEMFKQIVHFHLKILNLVDKVNELFNEIKYVIFFFGLLILCTALFQLQQSVLDGSQESFQCLAVCTCDILILFVYCSCGELITDACNISDAVYLLRWYNYDKKLKYSIRTIIARSQKPYKFATCSALNCSLQTFAQIVQKAGSAFAMLRSI